MPWQEITFELGADQMPSYEQALLDAGALSVTLRDAEDQPILEPAPETTPVWDKLLLTAMFNMNVDLQVVLSTMQIQLGLDKQPHCSIKTLEDREWRRTWMDYFQSMCFGERLWICPSGFERPEQPDAVVVDLDPGLAFGTGSHPTTALCMQWLDNSPPLGKTVVDYGCGSGVLAIAAAKLGAKRVMAVDNDPQALQATRDNAFANQVEAIVEVYSPDSLPDVKADIVIANILLEPLLLLRQTFVRLLRDQGAIVLSGILDTQVSQLKDAYSEDFEPQACEQMEDWIRFTAKRRS